MITTYEDVPKQNFNCSLKVVTFNLRKGRRMRVGAYSSWALINLT